MKKCNIRHTLGAYLFSKIHICDAKIAYLDDIDNVYVASSNGTLPIISNNGHVTKNDSALNVLCLIYTVCLFIENKHSSSCLKPKMCTALIDSIVASPNST